MFSIGRNGPPKAEVPRSSRGGCTSQNLSFSRKPAPTPADAARHTPANVGRTRHQYSWKIGGAVFLACSAPAHAGVVLPDNCAAHPTPPPRHYVERAIELQEAGLAVVEVRTVPRSIVNRECEQTSGLTEPVGFPGRRFAACTIMDVSTLPFRATIIIPETGREGALCHELGHVGGWPWSHPR